MTGKRRTIVLELRRDGEYWVGRIRGMRSEEPRATDRESVVRALQAMALMAVAHELRTPNAPLVKELVFEIAPT